MSAPFTQYKIDYLAAKVDGKSFDQFFASFGTGFINGFLTGEVIKHKGQNAYALSRFFVADKGKLVGTRILNLAANRAIDLGCSAMVLSCSWDSPLALKFYFCRGFEFEEDMATHANLSGDPHRVHTQCESFLQTTDEAAAGLPRQVFPKP